MGFPHLGQLNRAWTGGIFASAMEKLPAQLGHEKLYRRSESFNRSPPKEARF
jgi:hypothetical protein